MMRAVPVISISIIKGGIREGVIPPPIGSEVVVVKFARLRREVVTGAVLVAPAFLAKADAFYRGVWARSNNPTLLVLIDAVAGKPAGDDLRLPVRITLGVHVANFDGFVADDTDDLVRFNVTVAVLVGVRGDVGGEGIGHINLHQVSNQHRHYGIMPCRLQ